MVFADWALAPGGILIDEARYLRALHSIMILLHTTDVYLHVDVLERLVIEHSALHLRLFPLCQKPKLHYLHEVVEQIRKWKRHWSCFSAERRYRKAKRFAACLFKFMAPALLRRLTLDYLRMLDDPKNMMTYCISAEQPLDGVQYRDLVRAAGLEVTVRGLSMASPIGGLDRNSFVIWKTDERGAAGVCWGGGFVSERWHARGADGVASAYVLAIEYSLVNARETPSSCLFRRGVFRAVVHSHRLLRKFPYVWKGNHLHVIIPHVWNELFA